MSRGFPSMTALLGILAVAGYQNRDKIAEMLGTAGQKRGDGKETQNPGLGGLLGNLGGAIGGGGLLGGGLTELLERFQQSGQNDVADSWVKSGPNKPVSNDQLKNAIGSDVLADLTQQTGLSEQELLSRLSRDLPDAVDRYTPQGRLPSETSQS